MNGLRLRDQQNDLAFNDCFMLLNLFKFYYLMCL